MGGESSLSEKVKEEMAVSKKAALEDFRLQIEESCSVKRSFSAELLENIWRLSEKTIAAYRNGKKVLLMGNGGSAADAQHLVAELVGRYLVERPALAAVALTTNTSCLTAIGNDYSYDEVFSRQIEAIGRKGDIAVGISTSGNSQNVIRAIRAARERSLITVGMTGGNGGKLREETDYCLCVPSSQTPRIQEAHILLGHIVCEIIDENFADGRSTS
jgi:D-sedoheptulose 7-phosphate isomerase